MNRKLFFLLFLNILLTITEGWANMAKPPEPEPGNITGNSYLRKMSVLKEELSIDMSRIHLKEPVKVKAKYIVEVSEDLTDIELIFIANNLTESRYRVEIDGQFINGHLTELEELPASWLPPDSVRSHKKNIPYLYTTEGLILFRIEHLPKGQHTIEVDYDAKVAEWYTYEEQTIFNNFVYILKPTEEWKSFNDFNVTVFTPAEWDFKSNLNLREDNPGVYSGSWNNLPAPYLSVVLQKNPAQAIWYSRIFRAGCWLLFFLLALWWLRIVARFRVRKEAHWFLAALHLLTVSFVAAVVFYVIYFNDIDLKEYWMENQMNPLTYHGSGYFILGFPFIWFFSLIIVFLLDRIILKKVKKAEHNCEDH